MERWVTKLICGVGMLIAMLISFLLPIKLIKFFKSRGNRGQYYLDLFSCFGGGVFLSAYLIFMAPAVREIFVTNLMVPHGISYPLPDMLIGLGFFVLLLLNRVIVSLTNMVRRKHVKHEQLPSLNNKNNNSSSNNNNNNNNSNINNNNNCVHVHDSNGYTTSTAEKKPLNGCNDLKTCIVNDTKARARSSSYSSQSEEEHCIKCCHHVKAEDDTVLEIGELVCQSGERKHPNPDPSEVADQESLLRSIVLMLVLSFDSILEGVTTGLKTTNVEIWAIFIGNMVHETVIAFCLGLQLMRVHRSAKPVVIAAVSYSIMNPFGLALATLVVESMETNSTLELINGLIQALASGCFIYVTFCEILEGQITQKISYTKILCMFLGFSVLAVFASVPGSSSYVLEEMMSSPCGNSSSLVIGDVVVGGI